MFSGGTPGGAPPPADRMSPFPPLSFECTRLRKPSPLRGSPLLALPEWGCFPSIGSYALFFPDLIHVQMVSEI